ncbi:PTS glucitol/sorbitol transporter subunit IIA [Oceanobacillus kimchii]|uniref:PTS glucitol/sorbitol transporter subunit IIA n=1 Tax=Oceanobacillus kimchii TaxID=746691 RepID=UPI003B014002
MYTSFVKEVGSLALAFEEDKVVILFGPEAPQELRDVSIIHEVNQEDNDAPIKNGGELQIDDQIYKVTAVGTSANKNLKELGHISIYFSEPNEEILPGAVFVSPSKYPKLDKNSKIVFK